MKIAFTPLESLTRGLLRSCASRATSKRIKLAKASENKKDAIVDQSYAELLRAAVTSHDARALRYYALREQHEADARIAAVVRHLSDDVARNIARIVTEGVEVEGEQTVRACEIAEGRAVAAFIIATAETCGEKVSRKMEPAPGSTVWYTPHNHVHDEQFDCATIGTETQAKEISAIRRAGCELAEAAMYVVREYDGIHRLSLAISNWAAVIANEGDRGERFAPSRLEAVACPFEVSMTDDKNLPRRMMAHQPLLPPPPSAKD